MDSWCWYPTQIPLLSSTAGQYCPPSAVKVLVAQLCPTLCDPMDCSPPGSSVHGILQTRILEWVAFPLLQRIFLTQASNPGLLHCRFFPVWATKDSTGRKWLTAGSILAEMSWAKRGPPFSGHGSLLSLKPRPTTDMHGLQKPRPWLHAGPALRYHPCPTPSKLVVG